MSNAINMRKNISYYVHAGISIILMFGFQYVPAIPPLTHLGMQTLGIFLGLLWAWTFVDLIWPSILGIVAVGLSGFMTIDEAFSTGFGNTTTLLVFFVFIFAAFLTDTGICRSVAYWFISRKSCIGRPYIFVLYLFTACYVLAATAGGMAAIFIGWAIFYEVADTVGYKKGEAFPAACLVGIVLMSILGCTVFPFRPYAVIALNNARNILNVDCSFLGWAIPSFIASYAVVLLYILAMKYIFRIDASKISIADEHLFKNFRKEINFTKEQKIGALAMVVMIIWASIPSFLPADSSLRFWLSKFSVGAIAATILAILYAFRKNGKSIVNFTDNIKNGVDWQMIIMLAASFPVAAMMQSPESGVSALINEGLTSLLGDYSPYIITCIFIIFACIFTQVAHNLVMMIVLAPIVCNLSLTMGFDPMPCLIFLAFATNIGIATPGASALGAMLFANREWIPVKKCFLYTWFAVILSIVTILVFGVPLANMMDLSIQL